MVIEVRLFKVRDVARIPLELIFYPVSLSFVTICLLSPFLSSCPAIGKQETFFSFSLPLKSVLFLSFLLLAFKILFIPGLVSKCFSLWVKVVLIVAEVG